MRAAFALLAVVLGHPAAADDLDTESRNTDRAQPKPQVFEEIIVTAERRAEPVRLVPASMTVITTEQLAAHQVREVNSLRHVVPSLESAPAQGNSSTANIGMRGQVEGDNAPNVDPAVGLFLDGIYIARATGGNLELFDIERVEIIRGPQGTLFGRNTIGGAINIIPAKPSDAFLLDLGVEFGNYNARVLSGVFNTPLGEEAALRIAARRSVRDGFARSVPLGNELGDDDTSYVRTALRLGRAEKTTLDVSFDLTDTNTSTQWITAVDAQPPATLVPAAAGQPQDSLDNYVDPYTNRTWATHAGSFSSLTRGVSVSLSLPRGWSAIRLTSAFRELFLDIQDTDLDATPYDIATQLRHLQRQSQVTHELLLDGKTANGRVDWVGGLYYFEEQAYIDALSNNLVPITLTEANSKGRVSNDSISIFGQVRVGLSSALRLTAGVRRTLDDRQLTSMNSRWRGGVEVCAIIPEILDDSESCRATLPEKRFVYTPFTVALDFRGPADSLVYGRFSRGFRAGGYNSRLTSSLATLPFEPDRVDTIEFGAKAEFERAGLQASLAIYRSLYEDIQLPTAAALSGGGVSVVTLNAGSARIDGSELEIDWLVGPLAIGAALGITDAHYTEIRADVLGVGPNGEFTMTPPVTFTASVRWPFTIMRVDAALAADYAWRDETFYGDSPASRQSAFGIANARLTLGRTDAGALLQLWVRNLGDRHYLARAIDTGNGLTKGIPGEPRTYGLALSYRFGSP